MSAVAETPSAVHADPLVHKSRSGAVLTLTMNRGPVNALNDALVDALEAAIACACADAAVSVLHLRSSCNVFCAGADLALMQDSIATPEGLERMLALACDFRIASHEARIGLPEAGLGLVPGAGGTQRLTRLVGPGLARRLVLGAETVDGAAAERLGLVQWSLRGAELANGARALAQRLAVVPREAANAGKQCIAAAQDPARDGFAEEISQTRLLYQQPATRERVANFLARRTR